jgi:Cu-Zn family superoxide dismutase
MSGHSMRRNVMRVFASVVGMALAVATIPAAAEMGMTGKGHAMADLVDAQGVIKGHAMVMQGKDGLHISVHAAGLTPGVHAVHVHAIGLCTAPDFKSAGGHWNPTMKQHGRDNPAGMHMGDMPNMIVGADGTGSLEAVIAGGMLNGGEMPLLDADGAAVVIHETADDYKTDPAGAAGARIACGVVKG